MDTKAQNSHITENMVIALIKAINIVSNYAINKRFIALHSVMNKITGILLFVLPLTESVIELTYSAIIVCVVATFSAVQEWRYVVN